MCCRNRIDKPNGDVYLRFWNESERRLIDRIAGP